MHPSSAFDTSFLVCRYCLCEICCRCLFLRLFSLPSVHCYCSCYVSFPTFISPRAFSFPLLLFSLPPSLLLSPYLLQFHLLYVCLLLSLLSASADVSSVILLPLLSYCFHISFLLSLLLLLCLPLLCYFASCSFQIYYLYTSFAARYFLPRASLAGFVSPSVYFLCLFRCFWW